MSILRQVFGSWDAIATLQREVACDLVSGVYLPYNGNLPSAALLSVGTTRVKDASGRGRGGVGNVSAKHNTRTLRRLVRAHRRNRRQKRLCVGMTVPTEEPVPWSDFHGSAEIHHQDVVGDVPHDAQVV